MTLDVVSEMIDIVHAVRVAPPLLDYIVKITGGTRRLPQVRLGASPRVSVALAIAAQSRAASQGRWFAKADDVKALAEPVLAHRLFLTPEALINGDNPRSVS